MARPIAKALRQTGALLVAITFSAALLVAGVLVRNHDNAVSSRRLCERINMLDGSIIASLERQRRSLPSNAYYRAHPAELAAALANIRSSIREFKGDAC